MKNIEKVSSGKVKHDSLTGKSVIDPTISQFGPYMNKILGISKGNYINMLPSKKRFHLKLTNCQPLTTYSMASHVMYCILGTSIKTYHLVILFTLNQIDIIQYKKLVNGVIDQLNGVIDQSVDQRRW